MKNSSNTVETPESVWAALRETDRMIKESRKERELEMKKFREEIELEMKKSHEEHERKMKEYDRMFGSWAQNFGKFAEEYFSNSLEKGKQNFFGEKFDEFEKNVKGIKKGSKDEYDILLINGHSIGIVEVKFKAHENDLPKVLKKPQTFRINFPEYNNHRVYLGLATMAFYSELENECIERGIAILKQVGDTMMITDEHLKVF